MQNLKHLFIYKNGGRGDFLASILIGDVLNISANDPFILHVGASQKTHYKVHGLHEKGWNCGEEIEIKSFDDYDVVIRIKFDTVLDCEQALKLARIKLADRNFISDISHYIEYEKSFAEVDRCIHKIIPFQDLFDINKLKVLFFEYHKRDMTDDEEQRIVNNIQLNIEMLSNSYKPIPTPDVT